MNNSREFWVVYDGDCPMCSKFATVYRLKEATGSLNLLDARAGSNHPLMQEINAAKLDLDEGFVVKYGGRLYHGADATHLMGLMSSKQGWLNWVNARMFSNPKITRLLYPLLRATRNALLFFKRKPQISNLKRQNQDPVFKTVLGEDVWAQLPPALLKRYGSRGYCDDQIVLKGSLDVNVSGLTGLISKLSGALVPRNGTQIPVTVTLMSKMDSDVIIFDRVFEYPDKKHRFKSRMHAIGGDQVVEVIQFGLGWRHRLWWDGKVIRMDHLGYSLHVFGKFIPIPLTWFMGAGVAEERATSNSSFVMWVDVRTRFLGKRLSYNGEFKV